MIVYTYTIPTCRSQEMIIFENDTLKGNVKKIIEYGPDFKNVIERDTVSRVLQAIEYDIEGHQIATRTFRYNSRGFITESSLNCNDGTPCERYFYKYNENNERIYTKSVRHLNTTRGMNSKCAQLLDWKMKAATNWMILDSSIFIESYTYDSASGILEVRKEDIVVSYPDSDTNITINSYKFNEKGDTVFSKTSILNDLQKGSRDEYFDIVIDKCNRGRRLLPVSKKETNISAGESNITNVFTDYNYILNDAGCLGKVIKTSVSKTSGLRYGYTTIETTNYEYDNRGNVLNIEVIEIPRIEAGLEDTFVNITTYAYDDNSNLVKETMYTNRTSYYTENWMDRGKEITTKSTYKYDSNSNLLEKKYYSYNPNYNTKDDKLGLKMGEGVMYMYNNQSDLISEKSYKIYIDENGKETKTDFRVHVRQKTEEEKLINEYDDKGNVIKNSAGVTREIEYY